MKYHIGIFGTQMNVCTLIEKNIIDFFSCKKIKPDIDIWNLFEVAKNNLILNNKYNIIFIEMKDDGKVTSELGKYIRNVLNDKCISIIYFTYADKFDLKIFETHPYYILNVKKGYEQVTRILEELILYDKVSVQNYKYVSNSCINKILTTDRMYEILQAENIDVNLIWRKNPKEVLNADLSISKENQYVTNNVNIITN